MYKVFRKKFKDESELLFIGFEDWSNLGHGSDSEVISTKDFRGELGGTMFNDIAGHQAFLNFTVSEVKELSKSDRLLFDDAIKYSNIDKKDVDLLKKQFGYKKNNPKP